jgi:hypothetical protein
MKVLLMSSNPEAKVPENEYDLYVHFNSSKHFHKTPPEKSIIIVRQRSHIANPNIVCHAACELYCYKNLGNCDHECSVKISPKSIMVVGWKEKLENFPELKPIYLDEVNYSDRFEPTSGWAAIDYFVRHRVRVTVSGFNLEVAPYRRSKAHHINYEIRGIKRLVHNRIINSI